MIYTVTTNPNIDYYMDLRAPLRVGGINRSGRELLAPGGKGINVSLMLQTLGKPSCVLGYLAGADGAAPRSAHERHRAAIAIGSGCKAARRASTPRSTPAPKRPSTPPAPRLGRPTLTRCARSCAD